jgi:arylsulfatase A-like enzyme
MSLFDGGRQRRFVEDAGYVRVSAGLEQHLQYAREKARTGTDSGSPPRHETASMAIVEGGYKLIHNTERAQGSPEYELFDHRKDPLDLHDVAAEHPDVVAHLARELAAWQKAAEAARLEPDTDAEKALSKEELERPRALGYVQ